MSEKALPNWVKVNKKRFDTIKNPVRNAKRDHLQARPQYSSPINFNNSNKLIQEIENGSFTLEEALNKMADIDGNFRRIIEQKIYTLTKLK